jgi:hypothetical protein
VREARSACHCRDAPWGPVGRLRSGETHALVRDGSTGSQPQKKCQPRRRWRVWDLAPANVGRG